jgi:hypothetical protein
MGLAASFTLDGSADGLIAGVTSILAAISFNIRPTSRTDADGK